MEREQQETKKVNGKTHNPIKEGKEVEQRNLEEPRKGNKREEHEEQGTQNR